MKKFLAFILAFSVFMPSLAFADDPPTWILQEPPRFELAVPMQVQYDESVIPGARIYPLRRGAPAPVDGVLLNPEANAWIISQMEYVQRFWIVEMNRRTSLLEAWASAETQARLARHNAEIATLQVQLENANNQNTILATSTEEMIKQNSRMRRRYRLAISSVAIGIALISIAPIVQATR